VSVLRWGVVGYVSLLLLGYAAGLAYRWAARGNVPPLERVTASPIWTKAGVSDADAASRQVFYYTPQGASLLDIRYSWFVNLERPFRSTRLADRSTCASSISSRSGSHPRQPDQLPVGLAVRTTHEYAISSSTSPCAACHTGQLNVVRPLKYSAEGGEELTTPSIASDGGQA